MFTTGSVYYIKSLGLDPLQLVLVGTAVEVTVFLFEVPTGVVADIWGRRASVITGQSLMSLAYIGQGIIPYLKTTWSTAFSCFSLVVLAEIVRGVGWTFISGAREAWITDEIGEAQVGVLYLKSSQAGLAASLVGIAAGSWLASRELNLPYLTGGLVHLALSLFLVAFMRESGWKRQPPSRARAWSAARMTLAQGVEAVALRPVLLLIIVATAFAGASSEGFDRLWGAHLLARFEFPLPGMIPQVYWFGAISAAVTLLSIAVTGVARRKVNTSDSRLVVKVLLCLTLLRAGSILAFGLSRTFGIAVCSLLIVGIANSLAEPLKDTWTSQYSGGPARATVISMVGQSDALGQMTVGPAVGYVASRVSTTASMVFSALLLLPVLGAYFRSTRREETQRCPRPA
jgi:MFS family permease